ncbi:MAG: ACT domain-containing protein [Oscillospiraceae bacterium]|nr:ACT domain-containing protein [Oscillospiraceae bacterium]
MKAVVTVIGKDTVGILAKVSAVCSEHNANIVEVTQSVLQNMFAMIMLVEMPDVSDGLGFLSDRMKELGKQNNLQIHVIHEDIFNTMHKI